jgi:hypothetical protein
MELGLNNLARKYLDTIKSSMDVVLMPTEKDPKLSVLSDKHFLFLAVQVL